MTELYGKKILFISPIFFGYQDKIRSELISQGAHVDFFNERPLNSSIGKILLRLKISFLISFFVKSYYDRVINFSSDKNYDYLFLLIPETIDESHVNRIKSLNPNIKVVIYMWDSIRNRPHAKSLIDVADRFCTFDPKDSRENNSISFVPLFYINDYILDSSNENNHHYNSCFVGTIHSDRFFLIKNIAKQLKAYDKPDFLFFYCPSYLLFVLKKIFTTELNGVPFKSISFKPLSQAEIRSVIAMSKYVIDVEHPMQVGLTMRTIEMIGARRKLITTNVDVRNYDIFNTSNICFVDRRDPVVSSEFTSSKYNDLPDNVYEKYSIHNWVLRVFDIEGRYESITYRC
ncbi:lipopolysaccharide biosynthesis protein [Vibrio fluvialis]|nr:lipopolysaccharide biosynthesis protein [Vibrio fluvialis]MBY7966846.1 lipopolysaccharide biosynthesis protein [Vibrio fluvialis]MBY8078412.1 lipopolysaccharide biosynthesis protein [Vibrio fluvialis]